jgi:hypothetical protein
MPDSFTLIGVLSVLVCAIVIIKIAAKKSLDDSIDIITRSMAIPRQIPQGKHFLEE